MMDEASFAPFPSFLSHRGTDGCWEPPRQNDAKASVESNFSPAVRHARGGGDDEENSPDAVGSFMCQGRRLQNVEKSEEKMLSNDLKVEKNQAHQVTDVTSSG